MASELDIEKLEGWKDPDSFFFKTLALHPSPFIEGNWLPKGHLGSGDGILVRMRGPPMQLHWQREAPRRQ